MKLFVTVGTQLPFDRLVCAVDEWVGRSTGATAFAQIGPSRQKPRHMQWRAFIEAPECNSHVSDCDVVVAHAGMGSILTALDARKPIIVMPRRASRGEHRNDHQMATARRLAAQGWASVAEDAEELFEQLEVAHTSAVGRSAQSEAIVPLLRRLRAFVTEAEQLPLMDVLPGLGASEAISAGRAPVASALR